MCEGPIEAWTSQQGGPVALSVWHVVMLHSSLVDGDFTQAEAMPAGRQGNPYVKVTLKQTAHECVALA